LWSQVAAGACFGIGVLSKETMVLLLPGLLWMAWQHTDRRTRAFCLTGLASTAVLVVLMYPLLAVLRGELLPGPGHVSLFDALKWQFFTRPSSGSALQSASPARTLVDQWFALDWWLLLLGLIAASGCWFWRTTRPVALIFAVLLAAGIRPGYLPQPFVIAMLPFAALAVGVAGEQAVRVLSNRNDGTSARRLTVARIGLLGASVGLLAAIAPAWMAGNRALAGVDQSAPVLQAERWMEGHAAATRGRAGRDVLVDDTMWSDLVTHGIAPQRVIWFYKLDYVDNLDPSVRRRISTYRDFVYVADSPIIRSGLAQTTQPTYALARQAIAQSTPVASFGSGAERIVIRRVTRVQPKGRS
jgi:hypothetical protein